MSLTNLQNSPKSNESTPIGMDYKPFDGGLFNDMENEIWKQIPTHPMYEASSHGLIRNIISKKHLKPFITPSGYLRLALSDSPVVRKKELVHRLICEAFHENKHNKKTVNHIDGEKCNNHYSNLEWATQQENMAHALKMGLSKPCSCAHFKKKVIQMSTNGEILNYFSSLSEAEALTGVEDGNISAVCYGKRMFAGGYKWKFA